MSGNAQVITSFALRRWVLLTLRAPQVYEDAFQGFNMALALLDESSTQHETVLADVEELWESYDALHLLHCTLRTH
jgi:hypothetical protein